MKYLINPFTNMFNVKGKASLLEFWVFFLFLSVFVSPRLGVARGMSIIEDNTADIIRLLFLIPFLSIGIRRINETKFNKWLFLIPIVNLVLACFPAERGE